VAGGPPALLFLFLLFLQVRVLLVAEIILAAIFDIAWGMGEVLALPESTIIIHWGGE
jgi:hypothetical protein